MTRRRPPASTAPASPVFRGPWGASAARKQQAETSPKTTVNELKLELTRFAGALEQTGKDLQVEKKEINKDIKDMREEMNAAITAFVEAELPSIEGEKIERFAALADSVRALTSQSLGFQRTRMLIARETQLKEIKDATGQDYSPEQLEAASETALTEAGAALQLVNSANANGRTAQSAQAEWKKTDECALVDLDRTLQSRGQPALTPDNRKHYEPSNMFQAVWWHFTKGDSYRQVRMYLKAYGHGTNGLDVFADNTGFKVKDAEISEAVTTTRSLFDAACADYETKNKLASTLKKYAGKVDTDAEILVKLRKKATEYFKTPAFVEAAGKEYGEDFPRSIPLISAKITMLEKLLDGVNAKIKQAKEAAVEVLEQRSKWDRAKPSYEVDFDLDAYRRQNNGRLAEYSRYREAAEQGRNNTRTYTPDYSSTTYAQTNSGPSMLETMLWYHLLFGNSGAQAQSHPTATVQPDTLSPFTADLFGITKDSAAAMSIPGNVFAPTPALTELMRDAGVADYAKPGQFTGAPSWIDAPQEMGNYGATPDLSALIQGARDDGAFSKSRSEDTWGNGGYGSGKGNGSFGETFKDESTGDNSRGRSGGYSAPEDRPSYGGGDKSGGYSAPSRGS